ncbi:hypothetical protein C0J45_4220, partial [Silurus meridionalis]
LNLHLDGCTVTTSSTVKDLGFILDTNLSFKNHINYVTKTAFFHLRNIAKLRNMSISDTEKLVHASMTSRLDYCNALLGGCPASLINTYKTLNGLASMYLSSLLTRFNPSRSLRSQNSGLVVVPRIAKSTKGGRSFSHLAPKLWNSLPDSVRGLDTLSLLKCR